MGKLSVFLLRGIESEWTRFILVFVKKKEHRIDLLQSPAVFLFKSVIPAID
jgi:hypothetical protein